MQLTNMVDERFADRHEYRKVLEPTRWTFTTRANLHDAGYEGRFYVKVGNKFAEQRLVYDRILEQDVDYSEVSRNGSTRIFFRTSRVVRSADRPARR